MNFDWMKGDHALSELLSSCREAEEFVIARPGLSAIAARRAMEMIVKRLYTMSYGHDYDMTIYEMISDPDFSATLGDAKIIEQMRVIQRIGNRAANGDMVVEREAMDALNALHDLAGWYGMRTGILKAPSPFVEPGSNPIHGIMRGIHPENFKLRIEPYVLLNGDSDWLPALEKADVILLAHLPDIPESIQSDTFLAFLSQFEQNKAEQVRQIIDRLPLTPATAGEWEERRKRVPAGLLRNVDAYVEAMNEKTSKKMSIWRCYSDVLADQAGWYLQLAHPDYIPHSMRSGFVKPDTMDDGYHFIELTEAVEQMLRVIASESGNKEKLLRTASWCKEQLSLKIPAFIPLNNSSKGENREQYSKKALHIGNKKYFYLLNWDKPSLFRLRALSGEVGEQLVTPEHMADWGFAAPESEEAQRARQRAEVRAAEAAQKAAMEQDKVESGRKCVRDIEPDQDEIQPNEIRKAILQMKDYALNAPLLAQAEWCEKHIGIREPILLNSNELIRLRNRQQVKTFQSRYSRCSVDLKNTTYVIRRMTKGEFDLLTEALDRLATDSGN